MPTKNCAFVNCTSDSRYKQGGVKFITFLKPEVFGVDSIFKT